MDIVYQQDNGKGITVRLLNAVKNPYKLFLFLAEKGCFNKLNDKSFLKLKYRARIGKSLNISTPVSFNEKLQWLKLYDRKPEYSIMVDKYLVRDYIADKIGEQYLIPLIGVWESQEDVEFSKLPNQFVIKCNHNSGLGMYICTDKSKMDIKQVKVGLAQGLNQDYFLTGREWPYKGVARRIIAEQYLTSDSGGLTDYKIHCFNGVAKFILVCRDRFSGNGLTEDFYSPQWEHMSVKRPNIPNASSPLTKPAKLNEMLVLAERLSENIPFLRVDFYYVNGRIFFSELTFFPASGFELFEPLVWDNIFGEWLQLPSKCTF